MASCNNDRTVSGKSYAWRLLGMMPAISKVATVAQTSEWCAELRTRLYHTCIDILVEQINDLTGRDIHIRYTDKLVRRSRVFMDFLSMDCDEVSTITMCPTTQCASCWCPRDQLQDTGQVFPFRDNRACSAVVIALRFGTQGPGFEPGLSHKACYMPLHGCWIKLRVFFPFRDKQEIRAELQTELARPLNQDGTARERCEDRYIFYIY